MAFYRIIKARAFYNHVTGRNAIDYEFEFSFATKAEYLSWCQEWKTDAAERAAHQRNLKNEIARLGNADNLLRMGECQSELAQRSAKLTELYAARRASRVVAGKQREADTHSVAA